jgi:hypothetical protein
LSFPLLLQTFTKENKVKSLQFLQATKKPNWQITVWIVSTVHKYNHSYRMTVFHEKIAHVQW